MVKFGARVRTWDFLPTPNFVTIKGIRSRGKFLPKIGIFASLRLELLKPPISIMLKFVLRERT